MRLTHRSTSASPGMHGIVGPEQITADLTLPEFLKLAMIYTYTFL